MKRQEIFEMVAKHLFQQKERSMDGKCLYRGPNGKKCAIGILIPDEKYDPDMEGKCSYQLKEYEYDLDPAIFNTENTAFLDQLQRAHDLRSNWNSAENMRKALQSIANDFLLDGKFLSELDFA